MRHIVRGLALLTLCGILPGIAQKPVGPQHPPKTANAIESLLGLDKHAQPAKAGTPSTPTIYLDARTMGSPVALERGWRVGITSNEAAIDPGFDDSTWAVRNADGVIAEVADEDHVTGAQGAIWAKDGMRSSSAKGNVSTAPAGHASNSLANSADESSLGDVEGPGGPHKRPWVWFRLHIKLAEEHGPVALLIELPVTQNASMSISNTSPFVDVFADGKPLQPDGPHSEAPNSYQPISRIYNISIPASQTDLVIVLRTIYIPVGYGAYTSFFTDRKLELGNPDDLSNRLEVWNSHALFERLPRLVYSGLLLVLSLFLLALYFTQKGHAEYLLLALHELSQAPLGFIDLAGSTARLDTLWYVASVAQLVLISAYLYFEFLVSFLALRPRWYVKALRYTSPILAGVGPVLLFVGHSEMVGLLLLVVWVLAGIWFAGWLVFIFATLISATLRRNFEAGLLLIPLVLDMVGIVEPLLTGGMSQWSGHPFRSPLTVLAGPIPIHFAAFADLAGILSIVTIIFMRFLRIQHDQERANSELAAARSVQELMIPKEQIATPGFEVDSVYNPANEVGGDFFYLEPTEGGGLLVVLGDVAGKGLQAAMTVSMLMGALRRIPEMSPARILEALNRVLTGSEGLTTCQAAIFHADGELVIANAGHLSPYLNSQEVNLPGGLPLGAIPEIKYDDIRLYLHPGDRLLLLSDGVVEARTPSGELFGFDRVHNLSNQSAFYIADAAKAFGQEDDITVLTVRRLAQALAA